MKKIIMGLLLSANLLGTQAVFAENIHEPIIPAIAGLQTKAIVIGFAKNQYELGMAYYEGKLIPRNTAKAVEWLHRASEKNYAPAKVVLAKMNLTGDGVVANPQLGLRLLQQAAQKGDQEAIKMLQSINTTKQQNQQNQFSSLDEALLCKGWNTRARNSSFFLENLARSEVKTTTEKALEQSLKKSYAEQDQFKYYPQYKNSEGDTPDMRIFLPKNKQTSIFKKLETANFYGYGFNYKAELKQDANIQKIKDYLEQRDHFKFYSYTQAQIRQYQTEHKKIMAIDNDQVSDQAFKNLDKKFPLLNSLKNEKAQQAYIYSLPIVDESGDTHFSTYIQLIGINTSNPSYTLNCGVGEA